MKEVKQKYPDKVNLSAEEIDKEVKRLDEYVKFARSNIVQRLKPEAVQSCRMDMMNALEVIERKEGATVEESYNRCQESAEAIGRKYDGEVSGQTVADAAADSVPPEGSITVEPIRANEAASPQQAKPTDEQVAAYEKKRMELWSRMKELEREMDNEHQKLIELDNATAVRDRTKEDWAAMDAQAKRLLDAIGKQSDASLEHGKHVFQEFDTKYSREAIQ